MDRFCKVALSGSLSAHQERAIEKLKDQDRVLLFHGMGGGKTLTGLAAAEKMRVPATVVGPAALRHNFDKERVKHKVQAKVRYYSYNKPPPKGEYPLLIFDEAQRLGRLESQTSALADTRRGRRTLLATGTPIRNEPAELIPLLRALGADVPRDARAFNKRYIEEREVQPSWWDRLIHGVKPGTVSEAKNTQAIREMVRGQVDYFQPSGQDFPQVKQENIRVQMSPLQDETYRFLMGKQPALARKVQSGLPPSKQESKRLNAFLGAARQVSNTPKPFNVHATDADAPKIERATQEIVKAHKKIPAYRGVTYSNFIEAGIDPMAQRLDKAGIPHAVFTGSQSRTERERILDGFDKGTYRHLLISPAGAEGVDLKGVRLMQILEPHWNDARIEQAQARAVRYKSHSHLPPAERSVVVQRFQAEPRPGLLSIFGRSKKEPQGVDDYLYMISKDKTQLNEAFLSILKSEGQRPAQRK